MYKELEKELLRLKKLLNANYEDIDKSLTIIRSDNKNHYPSTEKKLKNLYMKIYNDGILHNNDNYDVINSVLERIDNLFKTRKSNDKNLP